MIGGDGSHPVWRVLAEHADLTSGERIVYIVLASCCGEDGTCWPYQATVADRSGLTARQVRRNVDGLRARGLVVAVGRAPVGGRTRDRWPTKFALPALTDRTSTTGRDRTSTTARGRTSTAQRPDVGDRNDRTPTSATRNSRRNNGRNTPPSNVVRQRAEAVLRPWWDKQDPRPQVPWPGAVAVLAKALGDGWSEDELTRALPDLPVISGGALDYWRRGRRASPSGTDPRSVADQLAAGRERLRGITGGEAR